MDILLRHKRLMVGVVLALLVMWLLSRLLESGLSDGGWVLVIIVVLLSLPLLLGAAAQLMLPRHAIRDREVFVASVVCMIPWWFWNAGWSMQVPGSRALTLIVSVAYLTWFGGWGGGAR